MGPSMRPLLSLACVFGFASSALSAAGCGSQAASQAPPASDAAVSDVEQGGSDGGAGGSDATGPGVPDAARDGPGEAGKLAGCTSTLATQRTTTSTTVSNMVVDYTLVGTPAASHHKVLLLLFNASSKSASTPDGQYDRGFYTPQQLGDVYFNDPNGVQAFMNEASYGSMSFSGRVVGWINLGPMTTPATTIQQNYNTYAQMATSYANFADYDTVYFVFLTDGTDGLQVGWPPLNSVSVSQGTFMVGIDFMINSEFYLQAGSAELYSVILPSRSWGHEFVHTLGSEGHDLSLNCGTSVLASSCAIEPYGNPFSLMGESAFGNHPTFNVKRKVGWLPQNRVVSVTQTGDYTLCPTETVDTGNKGLEIPLKTPISLMSTTGNSTAVFDRIMVEYRRPLGFDRYLDRLTTSWLTRFKTDGPLREDGVMITLGYQDRTTTGTDLLDMHPASSFVATAGIVTPGNVGKFADSLLYVGESYEFAGQSIKITTGALTGDNGIAVHVDY
jgi:hypothetical protein